MFKAGQRIWVIEAEENCWDEAEITGLLFMAECGDYILACSEYAHLEDDFESQLEEMCNESAEWEGVSIRLLRKALCFATKNQANDMLIELQEDS